MSVILFYDTETTGLPLWKQPSDHPDQARVCQLAAKLVDTATGGVQGAINFIIKPDGWTIPDQVAQIHGITTERADRFGIPIQTALDVFTDMWRRAELRVAHNESFDQRMLRIEFSRSVAPGFVEDWAAGRVKCTAALSTPIVKLPPTERMRAVGRSHYKTPNLGEAYQFFTGKPLEGAHDAMIDVDACAIVYLSILKHQEPAAA